MSLNVILNVCLRESKLGKSHIPNIQRINILRSLRLAPLRSLSPTVGRLRDRRSVLCDIGPSGENRQYLGLPICRNARSPPPLYPNGIRHISPAVGELASLPWVISDHSFNPESGC